MNRLAKGLLLLALCAVMVAVFSTGVLGDDGDSHTSMMYGTFWALVPPIAAIVLALITKEVYFSLFTGILVGGLFYANFNPGTALAAITGAFIDNADVGIAMFLIGLGIIVVLMNKAGGTIAYGRWASSRIKSKRGAQLSTVGLGLLLFVDDYFNCLTVGSVMMPVTDKYKVSRAKLAYIIDSTAAPICIIAPISSWAAAVSSTTEGSGIDGFAMFIRTIPYNFYALLTIAMMVIICAWNLDFGPMKRYEDIAEKKGNLFGGLKNEYADSTIQPVNKNGKVVDLVFPILFLIAGCIIGMLYTGGFFEGVGLIDAFADTDAVVALSLGSLAALILTFLLYIPRKVLTFKQFADSLPEGFGQMVPPMLILSLAWTLSGMCRDLLGAGEFVRTAVGENAAASMLLPAVFFLIAMGLSFSIGTSWGTFGILIPIVVTLFPIDSGIPELLVISIAACLAGAVFGDHVTIISDTTIMASTGAQCNLLQHVSSQLPYALIVAAVSFIGYLIAGFVQSPWVVLVITLAVLICVLLVIKKRTGSAKAA